MGWLELKLEPVKGANKFQSRLELIFLITLTTAGLLWSYVILTTVIETVDLSVLGFPQKLPFIFWISYILLVMATITWYLTPETKSLHFLLPLFWTLYLFTTSELIEANARIPDTWMHTYGTTFIELGIFPQFSYAPWPGYFYFSAILRTITGIDYHNLTKLLMISMNLITPIFALSFARSVFDGKKDILLLTLLIIALWGASLLAPSPLNMGVILSLLFYSILFRRNMQFVKKFILLLLITSITVSHGLTTFLIMYVSILLFILKCLTRGKIDYIKDFKLPTLFSSFFIIWLMYTSNWVLPYAVKTFLLAIQDPLSRITPHYVTRITPLRQSVMFLYFCFLASVLIWLLLISGKREFWRNLTLEKTLPLLLVSSMFVIPLTGTYAYEGLQRTYVVSIPFLAWFLIKESREKKKLTLYFLAVLLISSFFVRYSSEYANLIPDSDFEGARFFWRYSSPPFYPPVFYAYFQSAMLSSVVNRIPLSHVYVFDHWQKGDASKENLALGILDTLSSNNVFYYFGEEGYVHLVKDLFSEDSNIVYCNGKFVIHDYSIFHA